MEIVSSYTVGEELENVFLNTNYDTDTDDETGDELSEDESPIERISLKRKHLQTISKVNCKRVKINKSEESDSVDTEEEVEVCSESEEDSEGAGTEEDEAEKSQNSYWSDKFTEAQKSRNWKLIQETLDGFERASSADAKKIIEEQKLPLEKRTIRPSNLGGVAGGIKFEVNGILYKLAVDNRLANGNYFWGKEKIPDDLAAQKVAANEHRAFLAALGVIIENTAITKIFLPAMALFDYLGNRILAVSLVSRNLCYGSPDAGKTIRGHNDGDNDGLSAQIKLLAEKLNLAPHQVEGKILYTPADLEVHGSGSQFYLIDLARVFPPEPRASKSQSFANQLRPEMVVNSSEALSPDAFTCFQSEEESKILNGNVRKAFAEFKKSTLHKVAQSLPSVLRSDPNCLVSYLHSNGVNLRFLGVLFDILLRFDECCQEEKQGALDILLNEMIFRSSKATLQWALLQSSTDNAKSVAVTYLNLLRMIGNGADSYFSLQNCKDHPHTPDFLNGIRHPRQPRWNKLLLVLKDKFRFNHFEMVRRETFAENPILTESIVARIAEACGVLLCPDTALEVRSKTSM
jgi:hypothetical protein